ncbi:lipoate--protein ligase family protein [Halogeometricum limi]|uniref:Lipoate-protein ligase A n=1 Tax=Halogeometricum limi TaxID=555875 RepID=A0A1I6ITL1_9EURY|nr:lipoate--protein ligase family protein [Halogeometricum limi]SFR69991.1 Lipoate-protein ligase A [Halogeometricum limi]
MDGDRAADSVRTLRGRTATRDADRAVTARMADVAGETGEPAFRAWTPHRQVAFGRRDTRSDGYEAAREAAESRGFPAVERSVGGRVVAYTGRTVAFASAVPLDDARTEMEGRYETATTAVVRALRSLGVPARRGEPSASFCPGDHSVQAHGKICGIAQRVKRDVALVSGIVVVADHEEIAAVLDPVYDALCVPFEPDTVGSVVRGGGPADAERVCRVLEDAFVGERRRRVEAVGSGDPD